MQILKNKASKATITFAKKPDSDVIVEENSYEDVDNNNDDNDNNVQAESKENSQSETLIEEKKDKNEGVSLMVLGEIMMGGEVTQNLDYNYLMAFKHVYNLTKKSDFTYTNLSTNITNLESIEDAKSKYLVNKNILSALNALGVDAVSIASDHIVDFSESVISNTEKLLENSSIFVAGKKDMPVYFEKDGKRIAIVSTNSVILGTKNVYDKNGISVYDDANLKKNIEEAKKMSDFVIVDVHWGKGESYFGVTDLMWQISRYAIDVGADLVMGTHNIGIKPIEIYNGKPIIYTTGYFMSDLEYEEVKMGYMFDLKFNDEVKLKEIEMTPIYINDLKETMFFTEYNQADADENMANLNYLMNENGVNSEIKDNKIFVEFN